MSSELDNDYVKNIVWVSGTVDMLVDAGLLERESPGRILTPRGTHQYDQMFRDYKPDLEVIPMILDMIGFDLDGEEMEKLILAIRVIRDDPDLFFNRLEQFRNEERKQDNNQEE